MPKRTQQLDRDREVHLFDTPAGPVWTTAGQLALTAAEQEQKSANVKASALTSDVQRCVDNITHFVNNWARSFMLNIVPLKVLEEGTLAQWMHDKGIHVVRNDLTWRLMRGEKELTRVTPTISTSLVGFKEAVLKELERLEKEMAV